MRQREDLTGLIMGLTARCHQIDHANKADDNIRMGPKEANITRPCRADRNIRGDPWYD